MVPQDIATSKGDSIAEYSRVILVKPYRPEQLVTSHTWLGPRSFLLVFQAMPSGGMTGTIRGERTAINTQDSS